MNLAALLTGCRKALSGAPDWAEGLDLSPHGLWQSFIALALSVPAYYVCSLAIATERAKIAGGPASVVPPLPFAIAALIYLLSFSASTYIICAAFKKPECFKPWVILRHWSIFFITLLAATFYGLYLLGIMPFMIANIAALGLYLATLAVDIHLAQRIGRFDITPAIFTACIIFAMGLSVLLISVVQLGDPR